jgi:hypothetical protein
MGPHGAQTSERVRPTMSGIERRALTNAGIAAGLTLVLGLVLVSVVPGGEGGTPAATGSPSPSPSPVCVPTWEALPSPDPQDGGSLLYGVAMIAADDGWAVGGTGDPEAPTATLTVRWNGAEWNVVSSPNVGTAGNVLTAVDALSPDAAWAVGSASDGVGERPIALQWDGAGWSVLSLPSDLAEGALTGVAALSTNDVWAVGYTGDPTAGLERALALHWDGSSWEQAPLRTAIGGGRSRLLAVSASGPQDLWAVGIHHNRPIMVRFDGSAWSGQGVDVPGDLATVTTLGPDDAWVAGVSIARWDGTAWSEAGQVRAEGDLRGVAAVSPSDVWAVGERPAGKAGELKALVQRWDGKRWSLVKGTGIPGSEVLTSVSALSDGTILAVGYRDVKGGRVTLSIRGITCSPGA